MQLAYALNTASVTLTAATDIKLLAGGSAGLDPIANGNFDTLVVGITNLDVSNAIDTITIKAGASTPIAFANTQTIAASGTLLIEIEGCPGPIQIVANSTSGASAKVEVAGLITGPSAKAFAVSINGTKQGVGLGGTVSGNLSQSGGTVTLAPNGSSSVSTSAGNLTLDAAATLSVGPTNATAVAIGRTAVAPSFPGGLTVAAAKAITGAGALSVNAASGSTLTVGGASNALALGQAAKVSTVAGSLVLSQNFSRHTTVVTDGGTHAYAGLATDDIILVGTTTGNFTVTIPSAVTAGAGALVVVKDAAGTAATRSITTKATAGTLDGTAAATGVVISANYGVQRWVSDGTNWFSI